MVALFTAVLWIPYALNRFVVLGVSDTVGYPASPRSQSPWAVRLLKAHGNAIENLAVFAALVLTANAVGVSNSVTSGACILYFWARVVHAIVYVLAVPWLRTLAFVGGFVAQLALAWQVLAAA